MVARATPLNTAALFVFTLMMAVVGFTAEFHPEMMPSSVTHMKRAGVFGARSNPVPMLTIPPDGVPVGLTVGSPVGTVTTRLLAAPVPS
jgi:hypothetical protein